MINLDREAERIAALDGTTTSPDTGVSPANVAYVIYTSGLHRPAQGRHGGAPAGDQLPARHDPALAGRARRRVLSFASLNFDVSVMDMFMPLLGGARVVLRPAEHAAFPAPAGRAACARPGITFACLPPAVLSLLTGEEFPDLRILLSAGEELSSELVRAWLRPGLEIYNGYGPTECAIGSDVHAARRQHAAAAADRPAQAQLPGVRAGRRPQPGARRRRPESCTSAARASPAATSTAPT